MRAAPRPGTPVAEIVFDAFASPYAPEAPADAPSLRPTDAELPSPTAMRPLDFRATVAALERRLLAEALDAPRHNQRATARHPGLTYHQLRNMLKKHDLLARPDRALGGLATPPSGLTNS